jgi:hypothetical protein
VLERDLNQEKKGGHTGCDTRITKQHEEKYNMSTKSKPIPDTREIPVELEAKVEGLHEIMETYNTDVKPPDIDAAPPSASSSPDPFDPGMNGALRINALVILARVLLVIASAAEVISAPCAGAGLAAFWTRR